MQVEFHAVLFDEEQARSQQRLAEVGFSFTGMSEVQRALLIHILRRAAAKLEEHAPNDEKAVADVLTQDGLREDS
jgi:hypothetical protein